MESASAAYIAYNFNIPFVIAIWGILNIVANEYNPENYKKFIRKASLNSNFGYFLDWYHYLALDWPFQ